jgi:hypothetical protein
MWWVVTAVGVLTAGLMLLYDRIVKPLPTGSSAS